ncbi:MAG: hypothetical protein ACJAVA_002584 [Flavobacteriaceae bacterium]
MVEDAASIGTDRSDLTDSTTSAINGTFDYFYYNVSSATYLVIYTDGRAINFQSIDFGFVVGTTYSELTAYANSGGGLLGSQAITNVFPNNNETTVTATFTNSIFQNVDEIRFTGINNYGANEMNGFIYDNMVIGDPVNSDSAPTASSVSFTGTLQAG